jgi:2-succinyl-5-enolpyruvyl-6-hydroxy-3-cyclohexene-1-carboxylate synthase
MPGVERRTPTPARTSSADETGVRDAAEETGALNLRWAERFVAALAQAGVREAVVSPGSRSAPLAAALHRSRIRTHVALDERAGAFFALGLAKASGRPAAVLCTSGTAAANFHPAILEAHHARVPLIALTADRPPELRDTGAPQTTNQLHLYGSAVRWFCEVGAPSSGPEALRYVASLGKRAAAAAWGPPSGPVHLNFPFREPLLPRPDAALPDAGRAGAGSADATLGDDADAPERIRPPERSVDRVARKLARLKRGLIVAGPDDAGADYPDAIRELAEATGYPVLADPLSGLRYGADDRRGILGAYDVFLRSPRFVDGPAPEVFLYFGAPPTSKVFDRYAARFPAALHVGVDPAGAFRDPGRRMATVLRGDSAPTAAALAAALATGAAPSKSGPGARPGDPDWGDLFARAEQAARAALARGLAAEPDSISEASLFPALLAALPADALLMAGNSMPVRDLDSFAPRSDRSLRAIANRGLNGVDGVVSTALGASAAGDAPLLAVVGDLSFHHDLNGLSALREGRARAVIVVVNNDGGGIFSFLPAAEHRDLFERYFGTPHGLEFGAAAALYGIPYSRPSSRRELVERAGDALRARRSEIIEVRTDRARNAEHHRTLLADAIRAVEEAL